MVYYEMIREIFNECSGNQMRDVFIEEVQTDDLDLFVRQFLVGGTVSFEKTEKPDGAIFDIETDRLKQRVTFTAQ
jgi:hypothetical protein